MDLSLSELLTELQYNLRITSTETGVFGDTTFRKLILNRGQMDFVRRTRCMSSKLSFTTTINQQEYDLGDQADFLQVDKEGGVLYNNKRIDYKTLSSLDLVRGDNWRALSAGIPTEYYIRRLRIIGLVPKPSTAQTVIVYYLERPTDMSANGDYPFNNDPLLTEYEEAPLLYATWKLLLRGRQIQEAMSYRGEYMALVAQCKIDLNDVEEERPRLRPYIYRQRL